MTYFHVHLLLFLCFCCFGGTTLGDVEASGEDQDYITGAETVNGDQEDDTEDLLEPSTEGAMKLLLINDFQTQDYPAHLPGPLTEGQLKSLLLADYHRGGRPVLDASSPVSVIVGLTLQQIMELDEAKGTFTAVIWFNFEWKDEFLLWNSSDTKISDLRMTTEEIWIPDIEVYNGVSKRSQTRDDTLVVLQSNGNIVWVPPYQLTTTCKIDTTWFPFDEQRCDIKMGSWTYSGFKIDLQLKHDDGMDISGFVTNKDWELVGTTAMRNEVLYECCPEPYLDVTFTVTLRRRTLRHLTGTILPSVLLTLLAILGLLIPATTPTPRFLLLLSALLLLCSQPSQPSSLLGDILSCCVSTLLVLLLHSIAVVAIAATSLPKSQDVGVSPSRLFTVSRGADVVGLAVYLGGFIVTIGVLLASAPHLLVY